jgi:hypothetical protein
MAKQIANTSKNINMLIDSLPGITVAEEEQYRTMEKLEEENREAGEELHRVVGEAGNGVSNSSQTQSNQRNFETEFPKIYHRWEKVIFFNNK